MLAMLCAKTIEWPVTTSRIIMTVEQGLFLKVAKEFRGLLLAEHLYLNILWMGVLPQGHRLLNRETLMRVQLHKLKLTYHANAEQ